MQLQQMTPNTHIAHSYIFNIILLHLNKNYNSLQLNYTSMLDSEVRTVHSSYINDSNHWF